MLFRHKTTGAPHVLSTIAAATLCAALLPGCASTSHRAHAARSAPNDALVIPPNSSDDSNAVAMNIDAPWEYGRNDAILNFRPDATLRPYGVTETYTRDRFSTWDGRLHENSRYEIRSYRIH